MKSVFAKIILVLLAFFLAILLFESLLRLFIPKPENLAKLQSSSAFLYENRENADFPYVSSEFNNNIHLNANGFRDDEFTTFKSPNTIRVAILGDSQEEALQVALADTWQKVMGRELSHNLGKLVETYNFGVSGYGTDQEWLTLKDKVWQFAPDMVILAFSPNDVGDTYKNRLVQIRDSQLEVLSARDRIGGNFLGRLVRETYTYHVIVKASLGSQTLKNLVDRLRVKILGFPKEDRFFLSDAQLVAGPFEVLASQKNPPKEVEDTWQLEKALIDDMKRQAGSHNAKFLVTINIPRAQIDPAGWEVIRAQYGLDPETSSPHELNDRLAKIAEEISIDFYDPRLDAIEWFVRTGNLHWPQDAHFNANGNLFMGTKMAEYIEKRKFIN